MSKNRLLSLCPGRAIHETRRLCSESDYRDECVGLMIFAWLVIVRCNCCFHGSLAVTREGLSVECPGDNALVCRQDGHKTPCDRSWATVIDRQDHELFLTILPFQETNRYGSAFQSHNDWFPETEGLVFWQFFRRRRHRRLTKWQPPTPPVTIKQYDYFLGINKILSYTQARDLSSWLCPCGKTGTRSSATTSWYFTTILSF